MPQLQELGQHPADSRRGERIAVVVQPLLLATAWVLAGFVIAFFTVRQVIGYAHRVGMLDEPGRRRSHAVSTPRGGGIGIVLAALVTTPGALLETGRWWPMSVVVALWVGLALMGVIGAWDDRRSLSALPRLVVQLIATLGLSCALIVNGLAWAWLPLLLLAGAWSINLHNFMDGIDGLLAQQAIFVFCAMALLAFSISQWALAVAALSVASGCFGFWLYNRAPAAIFMGDVGSASLGFLIFAMAVMLWRVNSSMLWPVVILSCGFVVDASATLISRMLHARRWSSPHREHLYQWMVRTGRSHRVVAQQYLMFNLFFLTPMAWLAWASPTQGWMVCLLVVTMTAALWLALKRRCLRRERVRS